MRTCGELRTDCDEVFRKKKRLEVAIVYGRSILDVVRGTSLNWMLLIAEGIPCNSSLPSISVATGRVLILEPGRVQAIRPLAIFVVTRL